MKSSLTQKKNDKYFALSFAIKFSFQSVNRFWQILNRVYAHLIQVQGPLLLKATATPKNA
jgi:hypothetical protein